MFCFPYAGASASIFRSWHTRLPEQVETYGIQLPGRGNRTFEPPFTRVSELVDKLGAALLPLLDRPFVFFGHSMGAILSFELARSLRRNQQVSPAHLFVSGRRAPQIADTSPPLHLMNDVSFLTTVKELNGTPPEVLANVELLQLLLPALRADTELCETYAYVNDAPLPCPITAFGGRSDDEETLNLMEGWRLQTQNRFCLHPLEGDHFFIRSSEQELLNLLRVELSTNQPDWVPSSQLRPI
jgi:medium-chain acyl-[acyl-carrier-protein] hydrolase